MSTRFRTSLYTLLPAFALLAQLPGAAASTLNQNASWTIDRAGTTTKFRSVAYGDSIYAGYNGSVTSAANRLKAKRRPTRARHRRRMMASLARSSVGLAALVVQVVLAAGSVAGCSAQSSAE